MCNQKPSDAERREKDHYYRTWMFTQTPEVLDPERIINRTICGPDYDPCTVGFNCKF